MHPVHALALHQVLPTGVVQLVQSGGGVVRGDVAISLHLFELLLLDEARVLPDQVFVIFRR